MTGTWTSHCPILFVIILVINKSNSRFAVVQFCLNLYDYRPNWTPIGPITTTNITGTEDISLLLYTILLLIHFQMESLCSTVKFENKVKNQKKINDVPFFSHGYVLKHTSRSLDEKMKNSPIAKKISFTFMAVFAEVSMNRRPLSSAYD